MDLSRLRIVVRERKLPELMDLALRYSWTHAGPLAFWLAVGILPFAALNTWLFSAMLSPGQGGGGFQEPSGWQLLGMIELLILETPLATSLATLYLGMSVFTARPSARSIRRDWAESLPQLISYQVLARAALTLLPPVWLYLYGSIPYVNEVILLERSPASQTRGSSVTTMRRVSELRTVLSGMMFQRWLGSLVIGAVEFLAIATLLGMVVAMAQRGTSDWFMTWGVQMHGAWWLTIGFFTVVRFFCYLDARIRTEGWDVELAFRSEAQRLAQSKMEDAA